MVLYPGPLTGYPPKYPRDSIPVIKSYPDGTSWPTPSKVDFTPGQMLGCVLGARGLRKFFEEGGHELVLTSDKDGPDSEFERDCLTPHRPRWRRPITLNAGGQPPAESSNQKVSELAGAVHNSHNTVSET
jgi:hypothetical protein